jgi:hypothetical protein
MTDIMAKRNRLIKLSIFLFALSVVACNKKNEKLSLEEYIKFIQNPDNGFITEKELGDYKFQVLYQPKDYLIASEIKSGCIDKSHVVERTKELDGYQCVVLRVKSKESNELLSADNGSEEEYYKRLEYFSGNAQSDMFLLDGQDTLPCVLYHYERNYGLSPITSIVMTFKNNKNSNSDKKIFVFDDKILGLGKLNVSLEFDINSIPQLQL